MRGLVRPSYHQGFARSPGQSIYPGLWKGLVGAWFPAFGPTGLSLFDVGGYANHGTLTNMTPATDWISSPVGYALSFDGVSKYVSGPTVTGLNQFTVAAHVNPSGAGGRGITGQVDSIFENCTFYVREGLASGFTTGGNTYHETAGISALLVNDLWQNAVLRYDGAALSGHVDGVQGSSDPETGTPDVPGGSTPFSIGRPGLFNGQYWNGDIAYVCIWNRALAINEIVSLGADPLMMFRIRPAARRHGAVVGPAVTVDMWHRETVQPVPLGREVVSY